jgi:hypothetical protein
MVFVDDVETQEFVAIFWFQSYRVIVKVEVRQYSKRFRVLK